MAQSRSTDTDEKTKERKKVLKEHGYQPGARQDRNSLVAN